MENVENNSVVIEITNLKKRYRGQEKYALKGINLEITQGEFFGLLGPNGSGKTTLISILCGLRKSTAGEIRILKRNIKHYYSRRVKTAIGLVPQEIALYPTLTLQQNLRLFASLYGLTGSLMRERVNYCLEIAQLQAFRHKQIQTYSGGMKRRANLVVGLIHQPKILFLDEPTANVDPQSRNMIYESLKKLIKLGITIIYTTHYMEEAENLCSRLAIIDRGNVIKIGSVPDLIHSVPECNDLGEVFLHFTGRDLRDEE
ncbi:MAG: ABC transporter ATP-binding protein [Pseudomonadota bacterium]